MSPSFLTRQFLPFLFAFVLPLIGIFAWWGGFRSVSMGPEMLGPYRYAYLEHTGDYAKLPDKTGEVSQELKAQKLAAGAQITVLYSNPDTVDVGKRQARTGYLLPPGAQVKPPLLQDEIPRRAVLVARIQAGSLLAPSKVYAALDDYQQARGTGIAMPTVEIYEKPDTPLHMGWFRVEMPLEVKQP